jgi:hypothetical protein
MLQRSGRGFTGSNIRRSIVLARVPLPKERNALRLASHARPFWRIGFGQFVTAVTVH